MDAETPAVDERLVAPEIPYEIEDGWLVRVAPNDELRGVRHAKVATLLEAYVVPEYSVAIRLLTRVSELDDFAPDVSVLPRAPDEHTGGRQLEHLALWIVNTEMIDRTARRAAKLAKRGVRRLIAIDVLRDRVFDWSRELGTWELLDPDGWIEDPVLVTALPVAAIHATDLDIALVTALVAKRNATMLAALRKVPLEQLMGWLVGVLEFRRLGPTREELDRIVRVTDRTRLSSWLLAAARARQRSEIDL